MRDTGSPEIGIEVSGKNGVIRVTDDYLRLELHSDLPSMRAGKYHFKKPEFESGVDMLIGDPEYCIEDKYFTNCLFEKKVAQPDFTAGANVNRVIEKISKDSKMIEAA